MSEKIKVQHLRRRALLYVRQSSRFQVVHNLESQRLQYAMEERVAALGWQVVDVIDDDLGRSAGGSVQRPGFERMVAEVCLGQVGVVAARELSRFARNSRDWQQLVEMCRVVDTLLVDEEAIYDARDSNDRLLLGLKGSLNEYELDLLRQRAQKARLQKALRGELGMTPPVGYVSLGNGCLEKDPDQRVQQVIQTVFKKFLELGSARQVLMWLADTGMELPSLRWNGEAWDIVWRHPTYHPIVRILKHPVYAGAYAWGKTGTETVLEGGEVRQVHQVKPRADWLVLKKDHHEGYVSWSVHERIQEMIRNNIPASAAVAAGAVRRGPAMLSGLIRCHRCGRKLVPRYVGGGNQRSVLRYLCHSGLQDSAEPRCISFGGAPIDDAVVREMMRVIEPAATEAAILAAQRAADEHGEVMKALELERDARRYEADRAQRQYDAVDPENRLVAVELERRWNLALRRFEDLDRRIAAERERLAALEVPTKAILEGLSNDLGDVWSDPRTDVRLKKRIIRALVEEVIVDADARMISVVVHWKGGTHTALEVRRRRAGETRQKTPANIVEAVQVLTHLCTDAEIANWLTRNGIRTGNGHCWTRQRVSGLRHNYGIPIYDPERQEREGWMNLSQAASYLGVQRMTLSAVIQRGEIPAQRPLSLGPWLLKREDLDGEAGRRLAARIQRHRERAGRRSADDATPGLFREY